MANPWKYNVYPLSLCPGPFQGSPTPRAGCFFNHLLFASLVTEGFPACAYGDSQQPNIGPMNHMCSQPREEEGHSTQGHRGSEQQGLSEADQ